MSLQLAFNPHHLVLIPGLDGTGVLFEPFVEALPPGIDTTIVSFPHDKAIYDHDLFAVIRNVIPWNRSFIVVAESASGPIGMRFAAAQHENVQAVILVSSFVSNPIPEANWSTTFLSKPWYEKPPTAASVRKHLLGKNGPDAMVTKTVNALRTPWPDVLGHRIELMKKLDAREALKKWDKPVLYLRAEQDQFVSKASVTEVSRLNHRVRVVSVPGPHLLLQANPHGAVEVIRPFLEELAKQQQPPASNAA
jgi:pimeloyl-ACP methyl ester carboxylesterase